MAVIEMEHQRLAADTALVRRQSVLLEPVMNLALARKRLEQLQEFCAGYLQESKDGGNDGGDYGVIPGAGKRKVLLKSGADKLCDVYALADTYVMLAKTEDFDRGLFDYTLECRLLSKVDDSLVGSGLGCCSSFESKYRYREGGRVCPKCGTAAIIKGREEYGGGWVCLAKKGGCGAKFKDADPAIREQKVGRLENLDIIDSKNTVLKMAKKRAKIDAVIGVTRSSGLFTQDLEDFTVSPDTETPPVVNTRTGEVLTPPAQAAVDAGQGDMLLISVPQRTRLWATAKDAGWKKDEVKAWLLKEYHIDSSSKIPRAKYDEMIARLQGDDDKPEAK